MKSDKKLCDEIGRLAYELYERRGRVHGHDFQDWLEAERIVLSRHAREVEDVAGAVKEIRKRRATGEAKPKTRKTVKTTTEKTTEPKKKRTTTKSKAE